MSSSLPPTIDVEGLLSRYDAFLLDAYGVLVDREGPLEGAVDLTERIRRAGKRLLVVSNDASRLPATTLRRYRSFGFDLEEADVLTSGMLIAAHFEREGLGGARCIVLGPEDSREYVRRAGGIVTEATDREARVVVAADDDGYPFLRTIEETLTTIMGRLDRGQATALVLPNPDLIYPRGEEEYGLTSGMVARILEAGIAVRHPGAAARFTPLGKPHRPMFEAACETLGVEDRTTVVMIGDQLATDILGATDFGIDSVLLGTGLTRLPEALEGNPMARPTHWMAALSPLRGS